MKEDWKPGDVANGHVLGEDNVWRPLKSPLTCPHCGSTGTVTARKRGSAGGVIVMTIFWLFFIAVTAGFGIILWILWLFTLKKDTAMTCSACGMQWSVRR